MKRIFVAVVLFVVSSASWLVAAPNTLPFSITLQQVKATNIPALQSYQHAEIPAGGGGMISLIVGGRIAVPQKADTTGGLHTFEPAPADNFPKDSMNTSLWTLNPATGEVHTFPLSKLPSDIATALSVTNAESYYDAKDDVLYLAGGYGWKADGSNMETSDALVALHVAPIVGEMQKTNPDPQKILAAIQITHDTAYKVTGGTLSMLGGRFFLVFGQLFDGQYRAFGGANFHQQYTESIRIFQLKPGTVTRIGPVSSIYYPSDKIQKDGHPFHRRDGNVVEGVNPANGSERLTALGGVFPPGIIGGYANPIYIYSDGSFQVDWSFAQKFNQYESPVVVAWSPTTKTVYRALFGGITHYYLHQSPAHAAAYKKVSEAKRNDGLPFSEDLSFQVEDSSGQTTEYVDSAPLPQDRLLGASADFLELPSLEKSKLALGNGVLDLDKFPADRRVLIGYMYGGIEADNPLPLVPNTGTHATNSLFQIYLTKTPTTVIPASKGHEATPTGNPHH